MSFWFPKLVCSRLRPAVAVGVWYAYCNSGTHPFHPTQIHMYLLFILMKKKKKKIRLFSSPV